MGQLVELSFKEKHKVNLKEKQSLKVISKSIKSVLLNIHRHWTHNGPYGLGNSFHTYNNLAIDLDILILTYFKYFWPTKAMFCHVKNTLASLALFLGSYKYSEKETFLQIVCSISLKFKMMQYAIQKSKQKI